MGTNHNIVIKPYLLLGIIEGEGCFSIKNIAKYITINTSFILTQTIEQKPTLHMPMPVFNRPPSLALAYARQMEGASGKCAI